MLYAFILLISDGGALGVISVLFPDCTVVFVYEPIDIFVAFTVILPVAVIIPQPPVNVTV